MKLKECYMKIIFWTFKAKDYWIIRKTLKRYFHGKK